MANYRLIATKVGNLLKYDTTINEIERTASSIFHGFGKEIFPNDSITSARAQSIYNWILSLDKMSIDSAERDKLLVQFCREISPEQHKSEVNEILENADVPLHILYREGFEEFSKRNLHPEVVRNSRKLFLEGNFFHSVFEASKAYNNAVKIKSQSEKDGAALMMQVWGCQGGVLKITTCQTETDRNIQDGIKFLSSGLMQAIRNPTAHELAVDFGVNKEDCLDILSFISFLFRKLDAAFHMP